MYVNENILSFKIQKVKIIINLMKEDLN